MNPRAARGQRYDAAAHSSPAKLAVNAWLVGLVPASACGSSLLGCTALILDTRALLTTRALLALRRGAAFAPERIVVPNPDAAECDAMAAAMPGLATIPTTSHVLLAHMRGSGELPRAAAARAHALPQSFLFVWLDYCGNLSSKAGRARERDIAALFARPRPLLRHGAIVAVTMCKRGNVEMYVDELVDALVLRVQARARRSGWRAAVVGVASYAKPLPMYTVAFRVADLELLAAPVAVPPALLEAPAVERNGALFTSGWVSNMYRSISCESCSQFDALLPLTSLISIQMEPAPSQRDARADAGGRRARRCRRLLRRGG